MPDFEDTAVSSAPIEELWKILVDPTRYPEWWPGTERVDDSRPAAGSFTLYHVDEPERPWPLHVESHADGSFVMSCLTSGIRYRWQLASIGDRTTIAIHVHIPPDWAEHLDGERDVIRRLLHNLSAVAEAPVH